jgi:MFS family permease
MVMTLEPQPVEMNLWKNASFVRLWFAKSISALGSHVTGTAIPLTAAITLHATPAQMAFLVFAGQLPDLLFGLVAGVWVDRVRRRPLLMGADIGRALLLALIPLAAVAGSLSFELLWFVAFGCAALSLVFTLASVALLPAIVRHDQLVDANSKMHMSEAVLALAGPGLAGFFIQLVSAPRAVLADTVSFLASAWALGGVGADEKVAARPQDQGRIQAIAAEIREGLTELIRTPLLRSLAVSMGVIVIGGSVYGTVSILYLTRTLSFSPVVIGLLAAANGIGALLGAAFAGRIATRLTLGYAIVAAGFLQSLALFLVPGAAAFAHSFAFLAGTSVMMGLAYSVLSINQISLRQRITPVHLLGRVTAARRFLIFSMAPLGAVLGGWLGTTAGLQPTLLVAAVITTFGALVMWFSPIRTAI